MSSELALLTQLLTRLGKEGDAASNAGSAHGKLEELFARIGAEGDAASLAGSIHAKLEYLAANAGGDPGYLDGLVPSTIPTPGSATINTVQASGTSFGSFVEIIAQNQITTDFVIVGFGWRSTSSLASLRRVWFDIARGNSGAETTVAYGTISVPSTTQEPNPFGMFFLQKPVKVPANSRVAVRSRMNDTGTPSFEGFYLGYYPLS